MFSKKKIKCNFAIICLDDDVSRIKTTASSIKANYPQHSMTCVVQEGTREDDVEMVETICPVFVGGKTITSLINTALRNGGPEWNLIVVAGSWVQKNIDHKFAYFSESNKDIMFPVSNRQCNFIDGTINGIMMHRSTFDEVGKFSDANPLEICKMLWAMKAIENGCKFKAIVGTQIC